MKVTAHSPSIAAEHPASQQLDDGTPAEGALPHLQRENITMRIYRELRTRIMAGQFKPGETFTLRAIAESMGVSQTPVREALLQLSSESVLTFSPGRSVRVPTLTRSALEELGLVRTALECLAARHAAEHASPAVIEELERLQAQLAPLRQTGDITGLLDRNLQFHFALYRAAGLPTLVAMIEGLWARTGPYIRFLYRTPFSGLPTGHPHDHIIAGLREKNKDKVEAALRQDIESHWKILVRHAVDSNVLTPE